MNKSPINDVATSMAAELANDTKALAASLQSEIQQVGASKMSRAEFLAYAHRNWLDPSFRANTLKQVGNKAFIELSQDMVAAHGHPPVPPPLNLTGMGPPTINSAMAPTPQPPGGMMNPPPMAGGGVVQ